MNPWPPPSPTAAVNPSAESIAALGERPDDNAIIMVNLLRYAPGGGRDSYARYGAAAGPVVRLNGGGPVYMAPVINDDAGWETALLVRYPRRAAYLAMQSDPAYLGAIPDRTAGLSARLLYPFHDPEGSPDDEFLIAKPTPEETLVVCLSMAPVPVGDGSSVVLSLVGDMPMVSDDEWSRLTVLRFASADAATDAVPPDDAIWLLT